MSPTLTPQVAQEPIAVIGSGCRFPGGANSPSKLWELLKEPRNLSKKVPIERFNVDSFYHPNGAYHGRTNARHGYMLEEDLNVFDASFFNIHAHEADAIDPQHRLLLETVYEGLSSAGLRVEDLQGSPTAVYVGLMQHDFADITNFDLDAIQTYAATGTSACILSNRVSYFFDWHGPSMTIDTACSSSLVAVHHAVQQLRSGSSQVAIAAGANLMLSPLPFIVESKLNMLSPTGKSRMWDSGADGYARGEGVAAVVLKTLSQALRDGDQIECIIRESGVNQDGKTAGITMPNHEAQEALIRDTYARAGLDLRQPKDRCQYFEAHGTGTPAGDPQEAEAISTAFFGERERESGEDPLYVGSIKTIIGHTEGTAGIAGLMKASLAIQNGIIPPNMLFEKLSSRVAPFYGDLQIITTPKAWPTLPPGIPRRASVNSFGFGGTNAHIIIEGYQNGYTARLSGQDPTLCLAPITLSANNEFSLKAYMESLLQYIKTEPDIQIRDLVWTLIQKRSVLSVRRAITGKSLQDICAALEREVGLLEGKKGLAVTSDSKTKPRVLGVFTGQGAQWPAMGKILVSTIPYAKELVAQLDQSLRLLPDRYRPTWTLQEQLLLEGEASNVNDARFSQPLCCAVQIILVELLKSAGITFKVVVGHSSGEIACAFAAGFITASQAIRIAHLRGVVSKLASSPSGAEGAMMAAGTSFEDAQNLCALEIFESRICVAASNAPESVTLSGDKDAILEAQEILEDESRFSRLLKVDKAYHSHHMLPCATTYVEALKASGCDAVSSQTFTPSSTWVSSVYEGRIMSLTDLTAEYWKDNLVSPVLFSQAVEQAAVKLSPLDMAIEVGCHPALKNPCLQTIENCTSSSLPYTGCMERKKDDVDAFASALGYIWERFGTASLDIERLYSKIYPVGSTGESLSKRLPPYSWDHTRSYHRESRATRIFLRGETATPHILLGKLSALSTATTLQWQNFIKPTDLDWIDGHQLQGQTVFPGAGYVVMAMEAALHFVGHREVQLLEVLKLRIDKAVTFEDENSLVELNLTLEVKSNPTDKPNHMIFSFTIDSCLARESGLSSSAVGEVVVSFGPGSKDALPLAQDEPPHMNKVNIDSFYKTLDGVGYGYTKEFRGLNTMKRADTATCGSLNFPRMEDGDRNLILHPASLDVAFQTFIGAYAAPGDGRLRSILVPTVIDRIALNPWLAERVHWVSDGQVEYNAAATTEAEGNKIGGDIEVFEPGTRHTILHIEGLGFKPFSPPSAAQDHHMFAQWVWGPLLPDQHLDDPRYRATDDDKAVAFDLERIVYFYIKLLLGTLSKKDRDNAELHHQKQIEWYEYILNEANEGRHVFYDLSWENDTHSTIKDLIQKNHTHPHARLLERIGENMLDTIIENKNAFEMMDHDGLLTEFYRATESYGNAYNYFEQLIAQIYHRYQNMDILEIGGGTGGTTRYALGGSHRLAFNSYTFTDISSGFFEKAADEFSEHQERMEFRPLDIRRDPSEQEFKPHSYDLVIASNVLHATPKLEETMNNVRALLKPGGQLIIVELTHRKHSRYGFIFGLFADWWAGVEEGRIHEPFISFEQWDAILKRTGFSGIDCRTLTQDPSIFPNSVFSSHAVDEKILRLTEPLAAPLKESYPQLVVVGGSLPRTSRIVDELRAQLPHREITVLNRPEDILDSECEPKSTFLVLSDLEDPIFNRLNEEKFEALQSIFYYASHVLWLTEDAWATNPHQAMSIGLLRTLRLEYLDVHIQVLDVDDLQTLGTKFLTEQILRLEDGSSWQDDGILWTEEPELYLIKDRIQIARLKHDIGLNNRLNSNRRPILADFSPRTHTVGLHRSSNETYFEINDDYSPDSAITNSAVVKVNVHYTLAKALRVGNLGYFYLVQGSTPNSDVVVAFSESNASHIDVPLNRTVSVKRFEHVDICVLAPIAADLIAQTILSDVVAGTSIVIFQPPKFCIEALTRRAENTDISVIFASLEPPPRGLYSKHWLQLHEKETQRGLERSMPKNMYAFYDFSSDNSPVSLSNRICGILPLGCNTFNTNHLIRDSAVLVSSKETYASSLILEHAVRAASKLPQGEPTVIKASQLTQAISFTEIDTIIQWKGNESISARIQPIDYGKLFVDSRTYLLVGLAGDLGRSICRFMIMHGARHIVLSSRNPNIDPRWIEDMAKLGGNVMALPMNISNEDSVDAGLARITETMPPIGGVAFGPLVLQDIMFKNMDLEMMEMVLTPKVKGAALLNQRLSDPSNPLDFFVMFSSLVMVAGNPGQSAYSAANAFTHSLVLQRQARGLAGSTINIGAVYGVGYIARAGREEEYDVVRAMFDTVNQWELQALFAEAVVAGRKGTDGTEITTGMPFMDHVDRDQIPYFDDPRLGYFKLADRRGTGGDSAAAGGSVKDQLLQATSVEEVREIMIDGLSGKIRAALQVAAGDTVNITSPLIDQGVDSLSAVTIGTWFSKNLSIDIPLLKILGGASVSDLVDEAVERLQPNAIPLVQSGEVTQEPKPSVDIPSSAPSTEAESGSPSIQQNELETPISSRSLSPVLKEDKFERQTALSLGQEYTWKDLKLSIDPATFNSTIGMYMKGSLDVNKLAWSFNTALQRHDAFRTCFFEVSESHKNVPVQAVLSSPRVNFEAVKVADRAAADEGFKNLENHKYNIAEGRTVKIVNYSWSPHDHLLVFAYHRLVGDGWTTEHMFVEVGSLYNGIELPSPHSYAKFADRQRELYKSGQMSDDINYWESLYRSPPATLPIMSLPDAQSRANPPAWKEHDLSARLNPMIGVRIRERSRKHKSTPMQFYLAAFHILLARLTNGTNDIAIGVADTNRSNLIDQATMGYFANLLPIRLEYSTTNTFGETLGATKEQMRSALLHSTVPYGVMLDHLGLSAASNTTTPAYPPLFQAVFDYKQGQAESGSIGAAKIVETRTPRAGTPYDVTLEMSDDPTKSPLITIKLQTSLYSEKDAQILIDAYLSILSIFSRNPALRVDEGRLDQGNKARA